MTAARAGDAEHRPVRSYVLRQAACSRAAARSTLLPRLGIAYAGASIVAAFGRIAPVILEIGFGMGETTAAMAAAHPERNFLGLEVHGPGVGALLNRVDAAGLTNVRVIQHDAVDVVAHMIPPEALAGIHVYFPDPWPKKRHHKRRLLACVRALAERLAPDGYLHAATDWEDYAREMLGTLAHEPLLANSATTFAPRPATGRSQIRRRGLAVTGSGTFPPALGRGTRFRFVCGIRNRVAFPLPCATKRTCSRARCALCRARNASDVLASTLRRASSALSP
jgi:tRNA (guanine-N7-)-methyltransferase